MYVKINLIILNVLTLIHDPIDYIDMSIKDLKAKMKLRPKIIREIKNNKNPILMDESYIE